ncbi:integrase catalytic domain-containing protein [Trichonephila clavata]|uniref:Integrase catalytic domain-containing protein n=1 Tax=Trichonephila clavata TaxID=2740835 RepID=A0A8X6JF80_TRICU|nr:integrase catalytic domain-containing protein [Trichonephila clavata]
MAFKLNYKKTEPIRLAEEMGLEIPVEAKVIQLKHLIESSNLYRDDIDFVRELMSNIQEEKRDEIELQKLKLSQFEKEFELINAKKGLADISQVSETKESSSLTDNLECLIRKTARRLQSELQDALQSCGMVLHKWSSNSPELLNSSSSSEVEHSFSAESDLSVKTLGISWKPLQDCFVFKVSILSKSSFTKREVLSVIARLYDPLGFLGPVLTRAKILLQRLWQQKLDWDDVLPDQIAKEWKEFVTTFKCIETVKIDRFILTDTWLRVVLQGFADSSEVAYGAVVYLQCFYHTDRAKRRILHLTNFLGLYSKINFKNPT